MEESIENMTDIFDMIEEQSNMMAGNNVSNWPTCFSCEANFKQIRQQTLHRGGSECVEFFDKSSNRRKIFSDNTTSELIQIEGEEPDWQKWSTASISVYPIESDGLFSVALIKTSFDCNC